MVFGKGHVAIHDELRGQKQFSFRTPLVAPAIVQLYRVMALGHIEDGVMERSCTKGRKNLAPHHPCTYAIKRPRANLMMQEHRQQQASASSTNAFLAHVQRCLNCFEVGCAKHK
jgi:hypothetical protein